MNSREDEIFKKYKAVRNKVKSEIVKLVQQEQDKISRECKENPKKFWQHINRKKKTTVNIGDLKCKDLLGNGFEPHPSKITDRSGHSKMRDV